MSERVRVSGLPGYADFDGERISEVVALDDSRLSVVEGPDGHWVTVLSEFVHPLEGKS